MYWTPCHYLFGTTIIKRLHDALLEEHSRKAPVPRSLRAAGAQAPRNQAGVAWDVKIASPGDCVSFFHDLAHRLVGFLRLGT